MSSINLNLVDRGSGDPAIVFIHGFTCNLSNWNEQIPPLSDSHRCVAVDLLGHGASPAPREATVEALARAVNDTLDVLDLNDVVLVGHSMGCRVVSETFSQFPDRIRGVVYVEGSMLAHGNSDTAVHQANDKIDRIGMKQFVGQLYDGFFVESSPVAARDYINAGLPLVNLGFARELWSNLVGWDASRSRAILASLGVPALVIQSTSLDADLQRV
jgi:pimeloyl-ACP methyl ester carboxylesterase